MAGRIREDDIAEVREKAKIDDVVSSYVSLRNAGGGSLKGLCPFHDEKSPSFHVTPSRGFFHCFGCQEGGDVISFVMKHDGLTFSDAVESLADKYGVQLRREEDDGKPAEHRPRGPARARLIEANRLAQEFYAGQLLTPEAQVARTFLTERGFDGVAAEQFGVGFAPRDGEALLKHLQQKAFREEELVAAGLVAVGRSAYDRFRGRLLWPIREASGDTIGFGARRIFDDDRIDAKYLNTPETALYKKSQVLYGIDLARRDIARSSQAVVVEGYTDVMACHLAGVPTAVATCGTAFGDDHARVLRRFLMDHEEFRGEVIFTFDGDAAGQKAALRAFEGDQNFVSQTYVAVEPTGLDPCDLRLQQGDAAVRELVARRVPLYRFVLGQRRRQVRPRPGRRAGRRAPRGGPTRVEHPRPLEGRRLLPRGRRDDRRGHGGGPRRGPPGLRAQPPRRPRSRWRADPHAAAGGRARAAAAAAARPARPALRPRAGDAQAGDPAPRQGRPGRGRGRPQRLPASDVPRRLGAGHRRGWPELVDARTGAPGCGTPRPPTPPCPPRSRRCRSRRCRPPRSPTTPTSPSTCSGSRS